MKPEDRKRLKQHIEMIVEHKIPSNVVFCPNCEKDTECIHTAELYECKECGEDFAKYIVSRKPANSDVSMTQDVSTDIKTPQSVENTNPDYYKDELYLDEDFRMLAKTYPADVSAIGVTTLIDYVEALEAELARRTKEMHYANTVCMEQRHELARRDEELALTEKKLCNIDRLAMEEIARRDELIKHKEEVIGHIEEKKKTVFELLSNTIKRRNKKIAEQADIIARLKEDAERLIGYAVMFAHGNEDYRCTMCGNLVDKGEEHKSDCPVTMHRALMKELE